MHNQFETLANNDVVSVNFEGEDIRFFSHSTFKAGELIEGIHEAFDENGITDEEMKQLLSKGVVCEVLKPGAKNWQKGRLRLSVTFCPDVPESPLDDIRQQLSKVQS